MCLRVGAGRGEEWGDNASGSGLSSVEDENVLKLVDGDGCTTLCIY